MPEVRWRHDRSRLIISAAVLVPAGEPNDTTVISVRALLDTGATLSGLTPAVAKALELPSLGKKPVQTAGGVIQTDRYAFRLGFYEGEVTGYPHVLAREVYGIGLAPNDSFDVIIGMDVIGRSHLEMDADGACLFRFATS